MTGRQGRAATHHADFSRYEIAQPVEPLHIGLHVVRLVVEAGLGKTCGLNLLVGEFSGCRIRS